MTNHERTTDTIRLKDGRRLSYAEFGVPAGKPVFHFHGYPGSRLEGRLVNAAAVKCGVRFIAIDRPGMGLSDFKHNRTILDWPDDVIELADFMKIDQFAVEGVSGGGPYSAACAYKISSRLTGVGIVSGVHPFWDAGETWERPQGLSDVERFWMDLSEKLPKPDRELVLDSKIIKILVKEVFEAFRQGSEGVAHEGGLYGKPWGFKLEDISSRVKVHLWHGELDVNVALSGARAMAQAIPNCEARFYPQEGHYSTALNHFEEIMRALAI